MRQLWRLLHRVTLSILPNGHFEFTAFYSDCLSPFVLNIIHIIDSYSSSLARRADQEAVIQAATPESISEDARGCHFFMEAALSRT